MGKGQVTVRMLLNTMIVAAWIILMSGCLYQIIKYGYGYGYQSYLASIIFTLGIIGGAILVMVALLQMGQDIVAVRMLIHAISVASGIIMMASSLRQMIEYGYKSFLDSIIFTVGITIGAALIVVALLRLANYVKK